MESHHSENNRNTDPKVIGPGVWFTIHTLAMDATTEEKKKCFSDFMNILSVKFPCGKCRKHIRSYLNENPLNNFWNAVDSTGQEIGMFQWSWIFHNFVNARLGKPNMDWNTAYSIYMIENSETCTGDCVSPPASPLASSTVVLPFPSSNSHNFSNSNNRNFSPTSNASSTAPASLRTFQSRLSPRPNPNTTNSSSSQGGKKQAVSTYGIPYRMRSLK